jgi:hypothetical protein
MGSVILQVLSNLLSHLPLLIVYTAGLFLAANRLADQPQVARRALLAVSLLLVNLVVMIGLNAWLLQFLVTNGSGDHQITNLLLLVNLGRNLIDAVAIGLLFRALFPSRATGGGLPGWLRLALGGLGGMVGGGLLAFVLAEPLVKLFGISSFEGESGYFVFFIVIPLCVLIGGVSGLIVAWLTRNQQAQGKTA